MSEDATLKVEPAAVTIDWFKLRSLWQGLGAGSVLSLEPIEPLAGKLGISATWLFAELL
jgi:hypothetical protein